MATILLTFISSKGWSAIGFGSNATGSSSPPSTTANASLNISASARVLVCAGLAPAGATVSGMTWNGVAMTASATAAIGTGQIALFYQANPGTGAHNAQVTVSATTGAGIACEIMTGADQTVVFDSATCSSGSSTTASNSVTTITDKDVIVDFLGGPIGQTWTAASSQSHVTGGAGPVTNQQTGTSGTITPPSLQTLSWTTTPASLGWGECDMALIPAGTVVSTQQRRLTGVGL